MPSPDDEEGNTFWKKVINRLKEDQDIYKCYYMLFVSFVNFGVIKTMYENTTDKKVIIDCGGMLWQ